MTGWRIVYLWGALFAFLPSGSQPCQAAPSQATVSRPNILWILGEDMGPELGCYGYPLVTTPNLDRLAREGMLCTAAFTTAPVCSASRSALITGMYQTTIGAHNHRSHRDDGYKLPPPVVTITSLFRRAGYFSANVKTPARGLRVYGKTDFNFVAGKVFDGTDWNQRKPGQPFYAQINFVEPHRARPPHVWSRARVLKHHIDPSKVTLPPYYPDDPIVRRDWAGYLDNINLLDQKVGKVLKRLDDEGLADQTVVIFVGDNGRCHVRGKQFLYEGGIHVPLIIRWPGHIKPGTVNRELISGIDLSATSLKLAGITPPKWMQGRVFLGPSRDKPRQYIFAARDRCDETVDRIRCVRSSRYKYLRNFFPNRPYTQPNAYKEHSYPALAVMQRLYKQGKLTPAQAAFMKPTRPKEELYDLQTDPYEIHNLATDPRQQQVLQQYRGLLNRWIKTTGDLGAIPEKTIWLPKKKRKRKADYRPTSTKLKRHGSQANRLNLLRAHQQRTRNPQ